MKTKHTPTPSRKNAREAKMTLSRRKGTQQSLWSQLFLIRTRLNFLTLTK